MSKSDNNNFDVRFGKKILYSLSTGMYLDPFFLYREYIQNAADSIREAVTLELLDPNEARIVITIDAENSTIKIQDNGCGISADRVIQSLIYVGDSKKEPDKSMGRFGIGRMGGLGYCDRLIFETSAKGENIKSFVEWNAKKLTEILADHENNDDAISTIEQIVSYRKESCKKSEDEDSHYFTVTMEGVHNTHLKLLDEDLVRDYISQVAPVPFDQLLFHFNEKIYKFLEVNDIHIEEYNVSLNGNPVYKCYEDNILNIKKDPYKNSDAKQSAKSIEILDVIPSLIKDESNNVIGWYWVAVTGCDGVLAKYCQTKCLRLRHWNIQIGEADCLSQLELWPEERGNNFFVGEVHALGNGLYPNARRDYFEENAARLNFESALVEIFKGLNDSYRELSKYNSANRKIEKAREAREEFERNNSLFLDEEERQSELANVQKLSEDSEKSRRTLEAITEKYSAPSIEENNSQLTGGYLTNLYLGSYLSEQAVDADLELKEEQVKETADKKESRTPAPKKNVSSPLPSNISENEPLNKLTDGEKGILEKVRKILQEELSAPQYKNIWKKIRIQVLGEDSNKD